MTYRTDSDRDTADDEIITVRLSKRDAHHLRKMIDRDRTLSVAARFIRGVVVVAAPILVALITLWDHIRQLFGGLGK